MKKVCYALIVGCLKECINPSPMFQINAHNPQQTSTNNQTSYCKQQRIRLSWKHFPVKKKRLGYVIKSWYLNSTNKFHFLFCHWLLDNLCCNFNPLYTCCFCFSDGISYTLYLHKWARGLCSISFILVGLRLLCFQVVCPSIRLSTHAYILSFVS